MGVGLDYKNRIIPSQVSGEGESLEKEYLDTMYSIENALLISGAVPQEDYDLSYLMELAHPHVLDQDSKKELTRASPFD